VKDSSNYWLGNDRGGEGKRERGLFAHELICELYISCRPRDP
jgi:hypothetical protein